MTDKDSVAGIDSLAVCIIESENCFAHRFISAFESMLSQSVLFNM